MDCTALSSYNQGGLLAYLSPHALAKSTKNLARFVSMNIFGPPIKSFSLHFVTICIQNGL
jgi:hypothetical protein